MELETIFISIASYRDKELVPTIKDCLAKAKHPERLVFGICWQHKTEDEWDNLDEFKNNEQFKIIDIDYKYAKGACWARRQIQHVYNDETYYLQLDSHIRFITHWDEVLINEFKEIQRLENNHKIIISSYPPGYWPDKPVNANRQHNCFITINNFFGKHNPTLSVKPLGLNPKNEPNFYFNTRFIAGGFLFTIGQWVYDVPYDHTLYFIGEELNLAVRSYTHGYQLTCTTENHVMHFYTRKDDPHHWNDHTQPSQALVDDRLNGLFKLKNVYIPPQYRLGTVKTLREYEDYIGVDFTNQKINPHALKEKEPLKTTKIDRSLWLDGDEKTITAYKKEHNIY